MPEGLRPATDEEIFGPQPEPERRALPGLRPAGEQDLFAPGPEPVTAGEVVRSIGQGFNVGLLARTVGAPVDLGNFVLSFVGAGSEEPVGGSRQIQRALAFLRMAPEVGEEYPAPFVGRVAEEVGAGLGALYPFMTAAKAGMVTKGFAEPIFRTLRERPATAVAAETGLATLSGLGAATAQKLFPGDPTAELYGQFAGGFAVPLLPKLSFTVQIVKGLRRLFVPFTRRGAQREAAERIQELAADPEAAARALRRPPDIEGVRLTPGQITEDPGLLKLEQAVIRSSAEASGDYKDAVVAADRALRAEMADVGGGVAIERTTEFLAARLDYVLDLIKARGATAVAAARQRIAAARPKIDRVEANRIAREELDGALRDVRAQETDIWNSLARETAVPTDAGRAQVAEEIANLGRTGDPDNVPSWLRLLFKGPDKKGKFPKGALGESATLGEMVGANSARSRLLEQARIARAQGQRAKARVLDNVADSILDDVGALTKDPGELGEDVRLALDFSRELNNRFTRGPVGRLLGTAREGGPRVAPELTLETTIGRPGPAGGVAAGAVQQAMAPSRVQPDFAADPTKMMQASEDFMRLSFFRQATDNQGRVVETAARRFLTNNAETLKKFPRVKSEIEDLTNAQVTADRIARTAEGRAVTLLDKRRSRAALFLGARPSSAIQTTLKSRDPLGTMRQIVLQAGKDSSGEALAGLRTSFVEQWIARAELRSIEGNKILDGTAMQNFFKENFGVITRSGLFTGSQIARVKIVMNNAMKIERSITTGRRLDEVLQTTPDMLTDLMGKLVGAKLGARMADRFGSSLVLAHEGSKRVRQLTQKIPLNRIRDVITQAVLDPALMETLLTRVTLRTEAALRARLRGFMVNLTDPRERDEDQPGIPISERGLPNIALPRTTLEAPVPRARPGGQLVNPALVGP